MRSSRAPPGRAASGSTPDLVVDVSELSIEELRRHVVSLRRELDRVLGEQNDLIDLAYHDALTGLANRRAFDDSLEREWALAQRDESDSFVVIADLDGFKELNDRLGHAAGDQALRRFGYALKTAARRTDVPARIGGDEFGILLVRCDERAARRFEQRLRQTMAEVFVAPYEGLSVSMGHASLRHSSSPATALDRADMALLLIKRSRRRRQAATLGVARPTDGGPPRLRAT